ncbi:ADP-ribosylglycohydrolase family protein [Faecalicoccus pleomorphus]|uniref:ADP-ribosylglycohydrolase family protein n=1 Tax=Faecalicoccus pleomorphus TaxID=1323 RepID=UPI0022E67BB8|nr:ADP-ribosylglycohydrolase family protein [Faecalicoccus pleomorphus]
MSRLDKIKGILALCAIGDAMGSVTENLSFDQIREVFGGPIETFRKPGKTAFALGNEAGEVTDDFSQIYFILQEVLKNDGILDRDSVIRAILKWSEVPKYFDRFAGPTTRGAIEMFKDPNHEMKPLPGAVAVDYASKATNGAAMKIAPAAILNPGNIEGAIDASVTISQVTHDNSLAIIGAAAIAAGAAAGMQENATVDEVLYAGLYGAQRATVLAKEKSIVVAGSSVIERMKLAMSIASGYEPKEVKLKKLSQIIGSGLLISEAVPCAFGILAMNKDNALQAVIDAVNVGYDTDTVATIVGTIAGPFADFSDSRLISLFEQVQKANDFNLEKLASDINSIIH